MAVKGAEGVRGTSQILVRIPSNWSLLEWSTGRFRSGRFWSGRVCLSFWSGQLVAFELDAHTVKMVIVGKITGRFFKTSCSPTIIVAKSKNATYFNEMLIVEMVIVGKVHW